MTQPLGYYVSGVPEIDALVRQYGSDLWGMGLYKKLLATRLIAAALADGMADLATEPSIAEQIQQYCNEGFDIDATLQRHLEALDNCDERQCLALLLALVGYVSDELQQSAGISTIGRR